MKKNYGSGRITYIVKKNSKVISQYLYAYSALLAIERYKKRDKKNLFCVEGSYKISTLIMPQKKRL